MNQVPKKHSARRGWALLWFCAALCFVTRAAAQPVTPSETQYNLYTEGAEAFQSGEYEKAATLFKASLSLGELNITYLNLGRTYFRLGQCTEANASYAKALTAPQVAQPSPAQVLSKVEEYRMELASVCPPTILVRCSEKNAEVFVNAMGPLPCDGAPVKVLPGEHVVQVRSGERKTKKTVSIASMEQATVELVLPPEVKKDSPAWPPPGALDPSLPVRGPLLMFSGLAQFPVNASVGVTLSSDTTTIDFGEHEESSVVAFGGQGSVRVVNDVYVGASGWIYPQYKAEADHATRVAGALAFDANLTLSYRFPLRPISPVFFVEGGYSHINDTDDGDPAYQGYNFGAGLGVLWSLGSTFALRADLRAQYYVVSRTVEVDGNSFGASGGRQSGEGSSRWTTMGDEELTGQRILLGIGASFDVL